jgi:hypothetical protein
MFSARLATKMKLAFSYMSHAIFKPYSNACCLKHLDVVFLLNSCVSLGDFAVWLVHKEVYILLIQPLTETKWRNFVKVLGEFPYGSQDFFIIYVSQFV